MLILILFFFYEKRWTEYLRITGECALPLSVVVWYWRSKFPGLEKKSRKRGISRPASTNSVCSSSAVNSNWCVRSFSANMSKSLADKRGGVTSVSSSASAILSRSFLEAWLLRDNFEPAEHTSHRLLTG